LKRNSHAEIHPTLGDKKMGGTLCDLGLTREKLEEETRSIFSHKNNNLSQRKKNEITKDKNSGPWGK